MDCGIHPGLSGMDALPYTDMIEADELDLLLNTVELSKDGNVFFVFDWHYVVFELHLFWGLITCMYTYILHVYMYMYKYIYMYVIFFGLFSFHLDHCGALLWFLEKVC